MNPFLQWLASDAWAHVVQALLHTLWMGALVALVVAAILRRISDPFVRYRWCVAGLGGVLLGGLIAWSVLDARFDSRTDQPSTASVPAMRSGDVLQQAEAATQVNASDFAGAQRGPGVSGQYGWRCWLALTWLAGALGMLGRAAWNVGAAEQLRRSARPLQDERLVELVREARHRLGVTRKVRVAVTEKLIAPAVIGIVVPTLLLPLSLLTALPAGQLQLVLLHELAHIRRGDYLANLCQFVVESLLFFNPAIWWLSRQVRQEREACCDALASSLAEDRVEYARALARVAEYGLDTGPALAPGFADERRPGSLKDRIWRLLVPGYRSAPRLTWKILTGWMVIGSALLLLAALGTQWTITTAARLLTPQQRIAQIEASMKKLGEAPTDFTGQPNRRVEVAVRLRVADGSPLPDRSYGYFLSRTRNSSSGSVDSPQDGICRQRVPAGDLYFSASAPGYAPACLGPIDIRGSNRVEGLELVLESGFPVTIETVDADSGAPLADANLGCQFWLPQGGQTTGNPQDLTTDERGRATLEHCAALPLGVTVRKAGYETTEQRFNSPGRDQKLALKTRRALPLAGAVTDRVNQEPIDGAEIHVLRSDGAPGLPSGQDPGHLGAPLARTDSQGRFVLDQLPRQGRFWLLVKAERHAAAILSEVHAGQSNLQVALGPELLVRGRFKGDLKPLAGENGDMRIAFRNNYEAGDHHFGSLEYVPIHFESGVARFEFVSPIAGTVKLEAGDQVFERDITAPVEDWLIDLTPEANPAAMRSVTLQFVHRSGVPPKGTVAVDLPGKEANTATRKEMPIRNGEVSFEIPVGRQFSYEPAHTVGYWFERQYNVSVTNGPGPLRLRVPVVPAGAIYAQVRQVDGNLGANVSFSVRELKKSPLATGGWPTTPNFDSWSPDGGPRHYIASPLPLEGTYFIVAWQSNHFAVSDAIQLTEAAPEKKVELQFRKGRPIEGQVLSPAGKPLARASVILGWSYKEAGFGVPAELTDENGRFVFEECSPDIGQYSLSVRSPGMRTTSEKVSFRKVPLKLRLQPGLKLSGQAVDADSGLPLARVEIRAFTDSLQLPTETTKTDDQGQFAFDTLSSGQYHLFVDGCSQPNGATTCAAGRPQPVVLKVKPYQRAGK